MSEQRARAFIRRQLGEYQLAGVTGMTAKQRERVERLDVIHPERKELAVGLMDLAANAYGMPPHQASGQMRVINMNTGEITVQKA